MPAGRPVESGRPACCLLLFTTGFSQTPGQRPSWLRRSNIYEVNVRQYTPEGTFKAFGKHLDRLKAMGVEILWFMPINPISKTGRKGTLGSYYAVSDYTSVNPEFGTLADFRQLDYDNPEMRDSMIASMQYWIKNADIDGFRCDVAWNVPGDFWKTCIGRLEKIKPLFMQTCRIL
jgi:alpha-amylase